MLPFFDVDEQTTILFIFDSLIRAPTEHLSLKVYDITQEGDEVWCIVRNEISKTYERRFNLVYSGKAILEYIQKRNLNPNDYLFEYRPYLLNKKLQQVAKQIYGDKISKGGEFYNKLTLYDFRHSGSIHFRKLAKENPDLISLDALMHRADG